MVKGIYIGLLCIIAAVTAHAQVWDFSAPEKLSDQVNSPYEEVGALLSPDGKQLFFTRIQSPDNAGGRYAGSDVWMSEYDARRQSWTAAQPMAVLNNKGNNSIIGLNRNNEIIYTLNTSPNRQVNGIYFSRKQGDQWSKPEFVPVRGIASESFIGIYMSPDFDVMFLSMKGENCLGEEDLYISQRNPAGEWTMPRNLGPAINTRGYELAPYLSADKKRLYFSSNGHKGMGDADIFYADRLYNSWDTWSAPRNLGEKLNSKGFDAYFSIYGDSLAYFTSNRGGGPADIYRVKVFPGDNALAFGQRYLTTEETVQLLGSEKVSRRLVFERDAVELTAAQRELLFFIVNKVSGNKEVEIQLSMVEENNAALSQQRLNTVAEQLKLLGIEVTRILIHNNEKARSNSRAGVVEMFFYK